MADDQHMAAAVTYEIKIEGHLSETWSDWFEGLTFQHGTDGTTVLAGEIIDQAALHGLLKKIRDLGMPLLSVNRVHQETGETGKDTTNKASDIADEVIEETDNESQPPSRSREST
jgi:hypothetical protein